MKYDTLEFNKKDNGNWGAAAPRFSTTLYKVKDDYGYRQDNEWKWLMTWESGNKYFAEASSYSYEDAAEDLADWVWDNWEIELDWEFNR